MYEFETKKALERIADALDLIALSLVPDGTRNVMVYDTLVTVEGTTEALAKTMVQKLKEQGIKI